jgi:hypothetical protein
MRIRTLLVSAIGVSVFVVAAGVVTVYLTHPRDDAAYLAGLHNAGTSHAWDKAFAAQTDGYFVMQGEDACDWLGQQGMALWRTQSPYRLEAVVSRYANTTDGQDDELWGTHKAAMAARTRIAELAFDHICGASWEFHKPHYLWRESSGD